MLALVLQLVGFLRLYLAAAAIAGIVGDGVWVRSGRRVSALFAAGARSLCATGYCWQAGGVYMGIGFIIAGLAPWFSGVLRSISGNYLMDWAFHALCVVGLMIITLRFARTFSAAVGQRGMMRRLFLRFVHAGCG